MEMITSEILLAYDTAGLQTESRILLANVLTQADFVKFAKAVPLRNENELSMTYSRQFIEATKPVAVQNESIKTDSTVEQTPESKA